MIGKVRIKEQLQKDMLRESQQASRAQSSALTSAAYNLRQIIKQGMLAESPGGESWPPLHPWTKYSLITKGSRSYRKRKEAGKKVNRIKKLAISGKAKTALRRLAGATRYKKQINRSASGGVDQTAVLVGFITPSAAKWGEYHASGPHTVPVTPKMRRMLFALGLVVAGPQIRIPRRRHVEPVYAKNERAVVEFIRSRVEAQVSGGNPRSIQPQFR